MKKLQNITAGILIAVAVVATPIFLASGPVGCASIDPEANKLVVYAERTEAVAFETVNTFLLFEYQNRSSLTNVPMVTVFADRLRDVWPKAYVKLHEALVAYKSRQTEANQSALVEALAVVEAQKARVQDVYAAALAQP